MAMVNLWAPTYRCAVCNDQLININEAQWFDKPIVKPLSLCANCDKMVQIEEEPSQ